jgi:RimJ/RimL family protein N-acetyltransferase
MIRLVTIGPRGEPEEEVDLSSELVRELCANSARHYDQTGFYPPWCGYLAVRDDVPVGVCGFRGPPDESECVDIACRILPGYERQGVGSGMVEALVGIARDHNPQMTVRTVTEPEDEVSMHLLTRMGFASGGECQDPYMGRAWSWWLEPGGEPSST